MGKNKEDFNDIRESNQETPEFMKDVFEPKSNLKGLDLIKELSGMIERVNEGYENELEVYILFSDAEKAFKSAKESILEAALIERDKHEEKTLDFMGKKIGITQSGRYTFTGNQEWINKKSELVGIEDDMKIALQAANKGNILVDENGEVKPVATYTPSKRSLSIKLK